MKSYEMVKYLVEKTVTKAGLKVKAFIDEIIYETGRKVEKGFSGKNDITHDDFLQNLNYIARP